ncbi:hypothetical protein F3Y22_tig00110435pilonHSYRG00020 [Hibiscus syriacus]|uniref:Uncharacterized protein n=1 Tax=Hibiscus syriacus TaxID=106335 RepID=A0A6A3APM6_HIBSY|nr:hypothetical protein F3Y22_tig00110435pilonHSYRG00020 [Hibiscus syriacus]
MELKMELYSLKDAVNRVVKKQKLSCSKTQEVTDQFVREIEKAIGMMQSTTVDYKSVLAQLKTKLHEIAPLSQLEGTQKELNIALNKYQKQLTKPLILIYPRHIEISKATASMRPVFQEMYQILEAMENRNLEPALKWATKNTNKLKENGTDLLLRLHHLQFVKILQMGSKDEALKYARMNFASFAGIHMAEIQKLMGCLLYSGRLQQSPYAHLLSPTNWDIVAEELTRQFCNHLGQSYESPLSVTIDAGVQALPPLLKFMTVMAGKKQEWQSMKQLPVPVELDKEFQFHSIFVCPVSKEQSADDNPPMLMLCGHVLCKQSINKMSKNGSKTFKCPYCPSDIDATQCRQLNF